MEQHDFSHVPVRDHSDRICGILDRVALRKNSRGAARDRMSATLPLVGAGAPLQDTLRRLEEAGVLLVQSEESGYADGISGIINHSDCQKLPVRLFLFARIAELETRLKSRLAEHPWENEPSERWAREARRSAETWAGRHGDPLPLLHYLDLKDLGHFARHFGMFTLTPEEEGRFTRNWQLVYDVRNAIAHSKEIGRHQQGAGPVDPLTSIQRVRQAFEILDRFMEAFGVNCRPR